MNNNQMWIFVILFFVLFGGLLNKVIPNKKEQKEKIMKIAQVIREDRTNNRYVERASIARKKAREDSLHADMHNDYSMYLLRRERALVEQEMFLRYLAEGAESTEMYANFLYYEQKAPVLSQPQLRMVQSCFSSKEYDEALARATSMILQDPICRDLGSDGNPSGLNSP